MGDTGPDGFPVGFLPGVAISTFQNSGDPNSNWGHWETRPGAIAGGQTCGESTDFWNRYESDIQQAAALGCKCFRFSLEWSRAEPRTGEWDEKAFKKFEDMMACMRKHGLQPVTTLHHFVHPQWFEEMGGFESMDNIPVFLRWVEEAYRRLGRQCSMWITFNEPSVYTFFGYVHGTFPPGKLGHLGTAGRVLRNLLAAHCVAYHKIKELAGGVSTRIGIVHNIMRFESRQDGFSDRLPHVNYLASVCDHMWNIVQLEFLQTGKFDWRPVSQCSLAGGVQWKWPAGKPPMDWIGLNYYSRVVADWKLATVCNPGETMTDMDYGIYPDGFYKAIDLVSRLGVPIYVTETGIADSKDDRRAAFLDAYMGQIVRALKDGYDVRGMMYWSLVDNFEWAHGFHQRFGLQRWQADGSQRRVLREGARAFPDWCKKLEQEYQLTRGMREGKAAKEP